VTLVKPLLTYGSESLPLKREDENMLRIFDRRIIYGPIKENGIWKSSRGWIQLKILRQWVLEIGDESHGIGTNGE
jgi:hypothetical protein